MSFEKKPKGTKHEKNSWSRFKKTKVGKKNYGHKAK